MHTSGVESCFNFCLNVIITFSRFFPDLRKQFEVPPYSQQVAKGGQVEVRCHPPRGKPPPKVYWLQNGRKIDPNLDKNFLVTAEGHLIVVAARLTDSANYSCVAENIANTRTSDSAAITVYGKTTFKFQFFTTFCNKSVLQVATKCVTYLDLN